MDIRKKTLDALGNNYRGRVMPEPRVRVGATAPGEAPAIEQALQGDLQHNAGQTNVKRAIPEDYKYDPSALKPMAKMLWSMSVSLGHALAAHKAFVRMKSATISPDGLLGGRGYVMSIKDTRTMLHDACEALSALCDTIHDEINAPHWRPKLGQLEKADVDKIQDLLNQAQGYLDDPEEAVEDDEEEEEEGKDGHAGWHHPAVDKANKGKREPGSQVPEGGSKESNPQAQPLRHDMRKTNPQNKESSADRTGSTLVHRVAARFLKANSTLPVETMPGGPRIDHLDRADDDQTGPYGTYGEEPMQSMYDETARNPDGGGGEKDYIYPSGWDNELTEKQAAGWKNPWSPWTNPESPTAANPTATSAFPDSNSDPTRTEAWDFGIGDGNGDDAHGQGAGGYGEGNPGAPDSNPGGGTGNMGVYGPQSGLPKDYGGKVNPDDSDSNGTIENEIGGKGRSAGAMGIGGHPASLTSSALGLYTIRWAGGDPWAVSEAPPGTYQIGAPDIQETLRGDSPGTPSAKEAHVDPYSLDLKTAWYDGVYDFERPVEPIGDSPSEFAGTSGPMGPQEPIIGGGATGAVGMFMEPIENFDSGAVLPGDGDASGVARADYYDGPKPVNMQNTAPSNVGATKLPGEQMPAKLTPTTQRPSHNEEHMFATGELPGDGTTGDRRVRQGFGS